MIYIQLRRKLFATHLKMHVKFFISWINKKLHPIFLKKNNQINVFLVSNFYVQIY